MLQIGRPLPLPILPEELEISTAAASTLDRRPDMGVARPDRDASGALVAGLLLAEERHC